MTAITSYHKHSGLKQYNIIVQFYCTMEFKSPRWISLGWNEGVSRAVGQPALEAPGQNLLPGVFHPLEDIHVPWFMAPPMFKASNHLSDFCFCHHFFISDSNSFVFHIERPLELFWVELGKPGYSPHFKILKLNTSVRFPWPGAVTYL